MNVEKAILKLLDARGGTVTARSISDFRRMIPSSNCRTKDVETALRVCRDLGKIQLKTRDGVTHVRRL